MTTSEDAAIDSQIQATDQSATNDPLASGSWCWFRYVVALLLAVAAAAKIVNFVEILAGDGLLAQRPLLLTVIALEGAIATYLVFGNRYWSWVTTLMTFGVFAIATVYALLTGQHCNCIAATIGPQIMLPLDLAVITLSIALRPQRRRQNLSVSHLMLSTLMGVGCVGIAVAREARVERDDPLQFLLASEMIDLPWPLDSRFADGLSPLESGNWLVLVVRRDCEHCREIVNEYFADPTTHRNGERTAVFVAGSEAWPWALDQVSIEVTGDNSIQWADGEPFVASPAVFVLENGIVVQAADGGESDQLMKAVFANGGTLVES